MRIAKAFRNEPIAEQVVAADSGYECVGNFNISGPERLHSALGKNKRMSGFKHISAPEWALLIGLVLIAVVATLSTTKRQKLTQKYVCDQCGAKLWVTTDGLAVAAVREKQQRTIEETELSPWFGMHISTNCNHTWVEIHTSSRIYYALAGVRLFDISGGSGGQSTPPLTYVGADDRAQLESFLKQGPSNCAEFIRQRLQLETQAK